METNMKTRFPTRACRRLLERFALASVVSLAIADAGTAGERPQVAAVVPIKAARMIIEYNASAEDIGIQFFLDSDGWREVEILDPRGREIFSAETETSLTRQGGGTELFLESVEPPIEDLPLETFFRRFPEGNYRFRARDNAGVLQIGSVAFSHDVPAGPELVRPVLIGDADCAENVSLPVVIEWEPVTTDVFDDDIEVVRYEVIVENADIHFDVKFPAESGTELTVSPELLQPDTQYIFEVLAIEEGGNQTITEGCFTTAP